jgi:hypothetical protein
VTTRFSRNATPHPTPPVCKESKPPPVGQTFQYPSERLFFSISFTTLVPFSQPPNPWTVLGILDADPGHTEWGGAGQALNWLWTATLFWNPTSNQFSWNGSIQCPDLGNQGWTSGWYDAAPPPHFNTRGLSLRISGDGGDVTVRAYG